MFSSEQLKSLVSGLFSVLASSLRSLGWILSGPGDLSTFRLSRTLYTSSSVLSTDSSGFSISLLVSFGISPSGSFVKTLLKYFARMFAFSLSSSVLFDFGLFGSMASSAMPSLIFVFYFI